MDALQRWALALLFVRVIALIVSTTHWAQWVATLLTIGDQRKAWVRSIVSFDAIWQKVNLLQTDTDWKGNDGMDQVCRRSRVSTGGSKKQEYVECRWVREQWPSGLRKVMCSVHCIQCTLYSTPLSAPQIMKVHKPGNHAGNHQYYLKVVVARNRSFTMTEIYCQYRTVTVISWQ